jgi:cobalt-zinc-cadmium efflux system membrane fusion protein
MRLRRIVKYLTGFALLGGLIVAGFFTRELWLPLVMPASTIAKVDDHDDHGPVGEAQQVKLSPQAQANLRLVVKPLKVDTYWRTIQVPGLIVDRPAQSDRGIVAPLTGVVTKVHHFPGDTVKPGDTLFTLKLLSETLHLAQSELFKTTKEIEIAKDQKKRLSGLEGTIAGTKMIEIDYQLSRLTVAVQAYRTELQTRGLTPEQIDGVVEGKYVTEIEVGTPTQAKVTGKLLSGLLVKRLAVQPDVIEPSFEVQELKVELGQQVQAGQTMCLLSNHQSLYIEGRAFRQETPLLERAAKEGWPMKVEFMEEETSDWPALEQTFTIRHIANTIDTASRTFAFYLPLVNQSRSFVKDDRTLMLWRFRPGQKVRLHVQVEKLENVFVLPADAVVREGPEAYVFRQNGDLFDRKPVRVVHQDRQFVVIANDGSIPAGLFVAQNGATQINRVLKSGSGGLPPGFHMHADGSIHSNAAHK